MVKEQFNLYFFGSKLQCSFFMLSNINNLMETKKKDSRIKFTNIDTILLKVQTDYQFLQDIRQIAQKKLASENKEYFGDKKQFIPEIQLNDIHTKALYHAAANIINENNMINEEEGRELFDMTTEKSLCFCGCKKQIGPTLSIFANQQIIASLGSGVILLFFYLRHLRELVILCFLIFGLFSVVANFTFAESQYMQFCENLQYLSISYKYCEANTQISFLSVREHTLIVGYEYMLGMVMIIVWIFGIRIIRRLGELKDQHVDKMLETASDYAVKIDNLPYGNYTQEQLFEYIKFVWLKKTEQFSQLDGDLCSRISSIQIVYNMSECRQLLNILGNLSLQIVSCLQTSNFKYSNNINIQKIEQYRRNKLSFIQYLSKLEQLRQEFLTNSEIRRTMATTIAILQFDSEKDQRSFLKIMGAPSNPIQNVFLPYQNAKFKDSSLSFTRSPQPSDILWLNCQKKFNIIRWIIIWGVTIVILYLGYTFVSYTQTWTLFKAVDHVVVTIVLQLLNRLIWFWLSLIIAFEENNTKTQAIISSMIKSIIAQTINIIVNPMISTFVNNKSLYGSAGLAGMAVTYQIVMVCMMLIYYIFNPFYLGKKLLLNIKCCRNIIIRYLCRIVGKIDTIEEIRPVLEFYEGPQLPVAGAYVYMSSAIFHAMFYCHLQPIILLIVPINMTIFFIIMKYMLFNRCKILDLTNTDAFRSAIFFSNCAAAYYGIGSIFFYLLEDINNLNVSVFIPSIICLVIWFLSNLNICNIFTNITDSIIQTIKKYSTPAVKSEIKQQITQINIQKPKFARTLRIQSIETDSQNKSQNKDKQVSCQIFSEFPKNNRLINSSFSNKAQKISWKRKESYYANSTTNSLLQFQNILKQMKDQSMESKGIQLKKFCEQFGGVLKGTQIQQSNIDNQKKDKRYLFRKQAKQDINGSNLLDPDKSFKYTFIPVIKVKKQFQDPLNGKQQEVVYQINKFEFTR